MYLNIDRVGLPLAFIVSIVPFDGVKVAMAAGAGGNQITLNVLIAETVIMQVMN